MDAFEKLCEQVKEKCGVDVISWHNVNTRQAIRAIASGIAIIDANKDRYGTSQMHRYEMALAMFQDYDKYCDAYFDTKEIVCSCGESPSNPGHLSTCPCSDRDMQEHDFLNLLVEFCIYTKDKNKNQFNRVCEMANVCVEKYTKWKTLKAEKEQKGDKDEEN